MRLASQINKLGGRSIILIVPKCHPNPDIYVGREVTSMVGKAELKTSLTLKVPTICSAAPGIPFVLDHAVYFTVETQLRVRVMLTAVTNRQQGSCSFSFFLKILQARVGQR